MFEPFGDPGGTDEAFPQGGEPEPGGRTGAEPAGTGGPPAGAEPRPEFAGERRPADTGHAAPPVAHDNHEPGVVVDLGDPGSGGREDIGGLDEVGQHQQLRPLGVGRGPTGGLHEEIAAADRRPPTGR